MAKVSYTDHMITQSGVIYNPFLPLSPDQINIEDIAHSLSMQVRFNGHIRFPYSVAGHSVLLAHLVLYETADPLQALWALLHDAGEAYVSDIPTPIKRHAPNISKIEDDIMVVIAQKFGLPPQKPKIVGELDKYIAYAEADYLSPFPEFWRKLHPERYKSKYKTQWKTLEINKWIFKLSDRCHAKDQFLIQFQQLTNLIGQKP